MEDDAIVGETRVQMPEHPELALFVIEYEVGINRRERLTLVDEDR